MNIRKSQALKKLAKDFPVARYLAAALPEFSLDLVSIVLDYNTPFHEFLSACYCDNLEELRDITNLYAFTDSDIAVYDNAALFAACSNGALVSARWLVRKIYTGTEPQPQAIRLFQAACRGGHENICQWLWVVCKYPADIVRADKNEALRLACLGGHDAVVEFILRCRGISEKDLYEAAKGCPKLPTTRIVAKKTLVFPEGGTLLTAACREGHYVIVDILLRYEWGAEEYRTATISACTMSHPMTTAKILEVRGWAWACERDFRRLVKIACEHKSRVMLAQMTEAHCGVLAVAIGEFTRLLTNPQPSDDLTTIELFQGGLVRFRDKEFTTKQVQGRWTKKTAWRVEEFWERLEKCYRMVRERAR